MSTVSHRIDMPTTRAIARDAYIYGFPLVDNYRIQYAYFVDRGHPEYKGSWNQIFHGGWGCSAADRAAQAPAADMATSHLGANLRGEPLVLTMPAIESGRYYAVQFIDMYTHNFAYVGTRTTGNDGTNLLLAGPQWAGDVPRGIDAVIRCETEFAFVIYRTQLRDAQDLKAMRAVQAGYHVQTLGSYLRRNQPPMQNVPFVKPLDIDDERTELKFYGVLNFVLRFCPPHPCELPLLQQFDRLGIGARHHFRVRNVTAVMRRALEDGMADAWHAYRQRVRKVPPAEAGSPIWFGSRAQLKSDYLARLVGAVDGIYGDSREEAVTCAYAQDTRGRPLDGGQQQYRLRFEPGNLPPVNAFWSLTVHEPQSPVPGAGPDQRSQVNSAMRPQLVPDGDGGITLHIQRHPPPPAQKANWLSCGSGLFVLVLRLYWPTTAAFDGRWQPPVLQTLPMT